MILFTDFIGLQLMKQEKQSRNLKARIQHWLFTDEQAHIDIQSSPISTKALSGLRISAVIYLSIMGLIVIARLDSLIDIIQHLQYATFLLTYLYYLLVVEEGLLNSRNRLFPLASNLRLLVQIGFESVYCCQIAFLPYFFSKLKSIGDLAVQEIAINYSLVLPPTIFLAVQLILSPYSFPFKHALFPLALVTFLLTANFAYNSGQTTPQRLIRWDETQSYIYLAACAIFLTTSFCAGRLLFIKWKGKNLREELVELALIGKPTKNEKVGKAIAADTQRYKEALDF